MADYKNTANDERVSKVAEALKGNGFTVSVVDSLESAKSTVSELIPEGKKVFTGTSVTLVESGLDEALNQAPYQSVRDDFMQYYGQPENGLKMRQTGAASDFYVGSAHALTEDGKVLIASASGSQLPEVAYGGEKVVLVVGSQKLATDLADGIKRIEEHTVPLEDARAQEAYGAGTNFAKLLVLNNSGGGDPSRYHIVIVKQAVGF